MCGRYAINQTGRHLAATLGVDWLAEPPPLPRYNIAPQTDAPVLRTRRDGSQVLDCLRWGLVPYWADDSAIGRRMVNARAETAATSRAFRGALERRRCIVPASGFYEWTGPSRRRVPHWLHPPGGGLLFLAGIWESWRPAPEASPLRSFAILTTDASADVAGLHDRMPAVIDPADREIWLSQETPAADYLRLLAPAPAGTLTSHPVSTAVNHVEVDGPELLEPVPGEEPPLLLL